MKSLCKSHYWYQISIPSRVQSVNSGTNNGTSSTVSKCGRIAAVPHGSLAYSISM